MPKIIKKHLTDARISIIIDILENWTGPLSWELLVAAVKQTTGVSYTRQTLSKYTLIKSEFLKRKLDKNNSFELAESTSLQKANNTIKLLRNKISRLEDENNLLHERLLLWQENAKDAKISLEYLNRPLSPVNRGRTKKIKS